MNKVISSQRLRELRKAANLTQEQLAAKSKVNVQTISKLERGVLKSKKSRDRTVERFCGVFNVDPAVLFGEMPLPDKEAQVGSGFDFEQKSQLNHRITDRARNSLALVASRYGVSTSKIYEIAPFIFLWAAEESLRRRNERLSSLTARWEEINSLKGQFPYLCHEVTHSRFADEVISKEEHSIKSKDLFGLQLESEFNPVDDYDDSTNNPFACFLAELSADLGSFAKFDGWSDVGNPQYTVCPEEAAKYVDGDEQAANDIMSGLVALHQMPKELRRKGAAIERAKWVRQQAKAARARNEAELSDILDFSKWDGLS